MTKNQANKSRVASNVASLDVKNPIPLEPTGESSAFHINNNKKKYLPFLNSNDNFFQLLMEAKTLSATNNACVNSKTNFCIGRGIYIKDGSENKEFEKFKKRVNKKGQSFDKILKSVFNNHFTAGNNFIEVIRGQIGAKKFMWIVNRSFLTCRLAKPDQDDICKSVFISDQFKRKTAWNLIEDEAVELPIYYGDPDMKWYKSEAGTEHCIIHVKNEYPGYDYYGMPDNVSSLPYQILEYKNARYNIDIIDNNLVVGGVIFIEGNVTDAEGKKIARDVVNSHTGDGKRGRWAVVSSDKGIKDSAVHQFDTTNDGSYLKLDESAENKIIDSNNWDSALYGQHKNSSGLGNGGFAYLSTVFDTKNKTVIEPAQELVFQDFIMPFFEMYDAWVGTNFSELDLGLKTVSPASFSGEIDVNACLTKNEGREILGIPMLESKEKGEVFISEGKSKNNDKNKLPE